MLFNRTVWNKQNCQNQQAADNQTWQISSDTLRAAEAVCDHIGDFWDGYQNHCPNNDASEGSYASQNRACKQGK
jgi:hypothetical protein